MPKKKPKEKPLTAGEMIRKELEEEGFDGMISASGDCCCYLEGDDNPCPCSEMNDECQAGHITEMKVVVRKIGPMDNGPLQVCPPWEIIKIKDAD